MVSIGVHRGRHIFFFFGVATLEVCAVRWVVCILNGWVIVDVVGRVRIIYLLGKGDGNVDILGYPKWIYLGQSSESCMSILHSA